MSSGSVTERLHSYAAPYTTADRTGVGGGLAEEGEDIEVLELPFAQALAMTADGGLRTPGRSCCSSGRRCADRSPVAEHAPRTVRDPAPARSRALERR